MSKRQMHFSDSFYPSDPQALLQMIRDYNHTLEETPEIIWRIDMLVTYATIVPHGEWKTSGFTANMAYRVLSGSPIDTVVVIGPSHNVQFRGISVGDNDQFETPLGDILIDDRLCEYLKNNFNVIHYPLAHTQYSTEVQMPFIRHYMPNVKVVELVYGFTTANDIEPIIKYLLENRRYAVVVTTNLSQYHTLEDANAIDAQCIEAVTQGDIELLNEGCEACGSVGLEALLIASDKEELEGILLDYSTSADTNGDTSSVIGYISALFQEKL